MSLASFGRIKQAAIKTRPKIAPSIMAVVCALAFALSSYAVNPVVAPLPTPDPQFFSTTGAVLSGGIVCTYMTGTTTQQATFTDFTGAVANATCSSPGVGGIVLNSAGQNPNGGIWLATNEGYKIVVYNSNGVLQWSQDGVTAGNAIGTTDQCALFNKQGAFGCYVGYSFNYGTGVLTVPSLIASTTLTGKVYDTGGGVYNVLGEGFVGDGVTDNTSAYNALVTTLNGTTNGGVIYFPPGVYEFNGSGSMGAITNPRVKIECAATQDSYLVTNSTSDLILYTPSVSVGGYGGFQITDCSFSSGTQTSGNLIHIQSTTSSNNNGNIGPLLMNNWFQGNEGTTVCVKVENFAASTFIEDFLAINNRSSGCNKKYQFIKNGGTTSFEKTRILADYCRMPVGAAGDFCLTVEGGANFYNAEIQMTVNQASGNTTMFATGAGSSIQAVGRIGGENSGTVFSTLSSGVLQFCGPVSVNGISAMTSGTAFWSPYPGDYHCQQSGSQPTMGGNGFPMMNVGTVISAVGNSNGGVIPSTGTCMMGDLNDGTRSLQDAFGLNMCYDGGTHYLSNVGTAGHSGGLMLSPAATGLLPITVYGTATDSGSNQNIAAGSITTYGTILVTATVTFANLPTTGPLSTNGSMVYCSDCNATCSAGASTGQMCFRVNGAWAH